MLRPSDRTHEDFVKLLLRTYAHRRELAQQRARLDEHLACERHYQADRERLTLYLLQLEHKMLSYRLRSVFDVRA